MKKTGFSKSTATKFARSGEKADRVRGRIIAAAGQIVGKVGYPSASIAKITEAAGISNGLFYYYYESREDLFDDLLPGLGKEMIKFIVDRVAHLPFGLEREMAGFSAYFDYLEESPQFLRVFTEAQVYAPTAYRKNFQWVIDNYVIGLSRQVKEGHLHAFPSELVTLAIMLSGIRNYATQMLSHSKSPERDKKTIMAVYRQLLTAIFRSNSLSAHVSTKARTSVRRKKK